jgi:hypothetical protein
MAGGVLELRTPPAGRPMRRKVKFRGIPVNSSGDVMGIGANPVPFAGVTYQNGVENSYPTAIPTDSSSFERKVPPCIPSASFPCRRA